MRNLAVLLSLLLALSVCSCGGGSEKEKASAKPQKKQVKSLSIKTEEGMMKRLQGFGIKVPETLAFIEITKRSDQTTAKFGAKDVDETVNKQLYEWYTTQLSDLTAGGWKELTAGSQVNDIVIGLVYNSHIFAKPQGGGSTLSDTIKITSVYNPKKKEYTLYVSPNEY